MVKNRTERRAQPRVPLHIKIRYETADRFFQDYMRNLSVGGIFIETSNPLKVGTRLRVQFCLPKMDREIVTDGVVVRRVELGRMNASSGGMGVQFSDLKPEDKISLDTYVMQMESMK